MTSFLDHALDMPATLKGKKIKVTDHLGKETGWVMIRAGYDPEVITGIETAEAKIHSKLATITEAKLDARVSLITDWSFDEECTDDNIRQFLYVQPWNASAIDKESGRCIILLKKPKANSSNGQKRKSLSKDPQAKTEGPSASI